ncbi:unnamed protein product [Urochloa humidicola]
MPLYGLVLRRRRRGRIPCSGQLRPDEREDGPLLRLWLLHAASRPAVARPLLQIRRLRSASRPAVVRPLSGSAVGREQGWGGRGACRIRSSRRRQQQHQATRLELEAAAASSSQHDTRGRCAAPLGTSGCCSSARETELGGGRGVAAWSAHAWEHQVRFLSGEKQQFSSVAAENTGNEVSEIIEANLAQNADQHVNMDPGNQNVQVEQQEVIAKKCLLSSFDIAAKQGAPSRMGRPPRPPKTVVSMPTTVSQNGETIPLTTEGLRRSPRLNKIADGYKHCQLEDSPRKKRKRAASKPAGVEGSEQQGTSVTQTLQVPDEPMRGPIPTDVLKKWGIECGVPPTEITEELLLQKHPTSVPNDSTTELDN